MIEVELSKPIEAHGKEITKLEMREPEYGDILDMEEAGEGENKQFAKLIELLARIPPSSVRKIAPNDLPMIVEKILPFLNSPKKK